MQNHNLAIGIQESFRAIARTIVSKSNETSSVEKSFGFQRYSALRGKGESRWQYGPGKLLKGRDGKIPRFWGEEISETL